jgi:hypothetical protein
MAMQAVESILYEQGTIDQSLPKPKPGVSNCRSWRALRQSVPKFIASVPTKKGTKKAGHGAKLKRSILKKS